MLDLKETQQIKKTRRDKVEDENKEEYRDNQKLLKKKETRIEDL